MLLILLSLALFLSDTNSLINRLQADKKADFAGWGKYQFPFADRIQKEKIRKIRE